MQIEVARWWLELEKHQRLGVDMYWEFEWKVSKPKLDNPREEVEWKEDKGSERKIRFGR